MIMYEIQYSWLSLIWVYLYNHNTFWIPNYMYMYMYLWNEDTSLTTTLGGVYSSY